MSLVINGANEYLKLDTASGSTVPTSSTSFTFALWVKVVTDRTGTSRGVGALTDTNSEPELLGWSSSDAFQAYSYNGFGADFPSNPPVDGTWFYCFLRCGGTGATDLVGGFWNGSTWVNVSTGGKTLTLTRFLIGVDESTNYVNGKFAYVRLWNGVLTDTQLEAEKNATSAAVTTGLLLDRPLTSGPSDVSSDGNTLVTAGSPTYDSADMPSLSGDTTPPVFSTAPASANVASTSLDITATLNEAGTVYAVAVSDGATAPTSAEVSSAQTSGGGSPVSNGNTAASSGTQASLTLSGLTAGTAYDVYVVAKDSAGNLQASPTLVNITTASATRIVTLQARDAAGNPIADQSGVSAWVFSDITQAPDSVLTSQSISSGQLVLYVSASNLADGTSVTVVSKLSGGDLAVATGTVVLS